MKIQSKRSRFILITSLLMMWSLCVFAQPSANFSASPACVSEEMSFSNSSSGNGSPIASYSWDFGDGASSSIRSPIHIYNTPGDKSVTLTVIDDNGDRTEVNNTVTVHPKASTSFNLVGTDRCVVSAQSFNNLSSISAGTFTSSWDFGDGNTSAATDPNHTYAIAGTYTVVLTTNSNNSCVETYSGHVTVFPEPDADFTTESSVCLGEAISFANNSTVSSGNLTYSWNFGDGSGTSTEINPSYTYSSTGSFDVILTITSEDGGCDDTVTKTVNVYAQPDVDFTFSDICLDENVTFTNTSIISAGSMTYEWDFGDGSTSAATSPSHTYANAGSYTVSLTATSNNGCVESVSKEINVQAVPTAGFSSVSEICVDEAVSFTSSSAVSSGSLAHGWDFGDGANSTNTNPSHTYTSSGLYTVQLEVESDFGCVDTYSSQVRVNANSVGGSVSGSTTRCADDDATYTMTLSGHTGEVIRWERSLTGEDQWVSINHTNTTLDYSDLQETTFFRAIVKSGVCDEEASQSAEIQIDGLSEGGELSGSQEVCSGTNSTTLTLSEYTGTIVDWESSSSSSGPWTGLTETGTSLTVTDLTATTYYRVEVENGVCSSDYSSIGMVTVIPETVGGNVSGSTTHCADDDATYTMTLSGHTGEVIRWERSLTGEDQWISIDHTNTTLDYSDLQETTFFRAIVKSGVCDEEASQSAEIQIDGLSEGGELSGSQEVCSGTNSTTFTISDYTGTIVDWESSSSASGPWTGLTETGTSLTVTDLTATTYYRVEVENGVCSSDYSSIGTVTLIPETVGGSVSGSTTHCADDDATYTMTLSGHTGEVIRWERSLTGEDQWISIDHTNTTLDYSDLQETTFFRAIVKSGVCDEEASQSAEIQIDGLSEGGELSGSQEVCSGTNSTTFHISDYTGTIVDWESSSSASGPWTGLTETGTSLTVTDLTATTYYRVEVENGVCSSDYSSIGTVTLIPETVGGSVSGSTTRCADDDATYTMTLSGHTGEVIRWERSLTGEDQWISIDHTNTTLDYSDLQETTFFRAIVKSGVCDEEASQSAEIQIDGLSEGGELSGSQEVCSGTNSTTFTISDYTGTIVDWESSSSASGPWTGLTETGTSLTVTDLTATTYYRVEVENGVCSSDYSSIGTVTLIPETVGGSVSGSTTHCADDDATYTMTLSGHTGEVIRWERSLTGEDQWISIDHTNTTLDYSDLQETTFFRAIVKSGVCDEEASQSAEIQIDGLSEGGELSGSQEVCSGTNSTTFHISDYTGTIVDWESSSSASGPWTGLTETGTSLTVTDLTATTYYRVEVENGVCSSDYSSIGMVTVIPETVGGNVSGSTTHCADDDATYTMTLSGHTGEVIRWERSLTGEDQWISIDHTNTTLDYSDLQEMTFFRAIVKSGVCDEEASQSAEIQIDGLSEGGELSGSQEVCSGTNSTTFHISDYTGTIVDWESSSSASGPWTGLTETGTSLTVTDLTATTYYRVEVENGVCSSDYSSIGTVTLIPETVGGSVSGSTTRCADDDATYTMTLSGHTGEVIRWERSLTGEDQWISIDHTNTTLDYSDLQETTFFRAIVKSGVCDEEASQSAEIQIDGLSEGGELSGSQEVCSGTNSTTFHISDYTGTIVDWESSSSASGPWTGLTETGTSLTVTDLTATTYYRVEVENGVCSSDYSSIGMVTVIPETDAGLLTGNATLCERDNNGQVSLTGHVGNIVRWEYSLTGEQPWTPINETGSALDYDDLDYTTWYRVVVKSGECDQQISNAVKITIDTPTETGVISGTNDECAVINSGTLLLSDHNGSILKWQESLDESSWTDIANTTTQQEFSNLTESKYFRVQVKNGVCSQAFSEAHFVKVNALPEVAFSVAEVCEGNQSSFTNTTTVSDGSLSAYEWSFADGQSSTISNPRHTYGTYGTYGVKLIVESSKGCIDSLTQDVIVNPNPTANFTQTDVCLEQQMDFSDLSTVPLGAISTYNWNLGDGSTSTDSDLSHSYSEKGEFSVTLLVSTDKGCENSTSEVVEVYPLPNTSFTGEDVCFGQSTTFGNNSSITSGSLTYSWDFGDGSTSSVINPSHEYSNDGIFNVNLQSTSAQGCQTNQIVKVEVFEQPGADYSFEDICLDQTATFTNASSGDGLSFEWSFGDGLTSSEENPEHRFEVAGLYEVKLSVENENGCFSQTSKVIRVSPMPLVNFEMSDVCLEEAVTFKNFSTIASGTMSYNWAYGDGESQQANEPSHNYSVDGTYDVILTATSNYGCMVERTKPVTIHPLPEPDFQAASVCDGAMTSFMDRSEINSGVIDSYLWDFGDQTNSILSNPQKQYLNPGQYDVSLMLSSANGCKADTTRQVTVHDFPVANFSVDNVCFGFEVQTINTSEIRSGGMTYEWDFGDGSGSSSKDPRHLYAEPGIYEITLTASSNNNCSDVVTRKVEVYPIPKVSAGTDTTVSQGYSTRLQAEGGVSYSWFPLDGLSNSSINNPLATPLTTTDYEVTVTNQYGCRNRDTVRVSVIEDFKIVANNVFTPDDNGQNDTWVIQNVETFGDVHVRVYDRFGGVVFESRAYQNDWSGTYGNDILPDGTYFYVITFSEAEQKYHGALTIIRNR